MIKISKAASRIKTYTYLIQVVIYTDPIQTFEINAPVNPDGSIDINIPDGQPAPVGTTIQVVIYNPGGPTTVEGTLGPIKADGSQDFIPLPTKPSGT